MIPDNWPPAFIERMREWLGDEVDDFFAAMNKREIGLRLNPQRGDVAALRARLSQAGWETSPVPWCPAGAWMPEDEVEDAPGKHPYHTAGVYYLQDPSAMAAGVILDPRPGEWVLDIAAAPGGKATHIAARMEQRGVLVANDVSRGRASVLAKNIERMGVTNALVANETPPRLAARWASLFDAVLVDAPCSGESTFARDDHAARRWSLAEVRSYAHRQGEILAQCARLVRPGGRLLYGTCTFSPEENEGVIAAFLVEHEDFELVDLPALPGLQPGRPEWIAAPAMLARAGRFWPHLAPGHGHFYALLHRTGEPARALPERWTGTQVPGRVLRRYREGVGAALRDDPPEEGLYLDTPHDHLYITPLAPDLWDGLHVLRPGWWVASLRHNQVNADHALAVAIRPEEARATLDLAPDDPRLAQFLRGSGWPSDGPQGVVLVTLEGRFPLGWAKRSGGRLHSRYPMHLRK